ncbi:hypothetical protein BJY04DRAFT_182586 [Aspergillus karnatakaensis]|uniref:uncharacterized protein n=1 Tax=Aspergillus karnatakaensis TaxID=1810916 RepID=UPI003CCDF1BA
MPALTLHLLTLTPATTPQTFLANLKNHAGVKIIVASQPRRVIISPTILDSDPLLTESWDLLLLLQQLDPGTSLFPADLTSQIKEEYKINVGIPSKLLSTYTVRSNQLKQDAKSAPLTGSLDNLNPEESGQNLEVSGELLKFMENFTKNVHDGAVTMLNLLHFHQPGGKESYYRYGQAFTPVAAKRGGNAKLVGNVIRPSLSSSSASKSSTGLDSRGAVDRPEETWWNEISIVHYPSLRHFCDMLAGEDYQEVNRKHRLGALRDTFLLCTTEFDLDDIEAAKKRKEKQAKL